LSVQILNGVWASGDGLVIAVGNNGTILHFTGNLPTEPGGTCARPVSIYCGTTLEGGTHGKQAAFNGYDCTAGDLTGPEVHYRLENPVTGEVVVRLTPYDDDLDLVVLGETGGSGCDTSTRGRRTWSR
jgi:hypothetical protein